eukprot:936605-Rhodomonas_salina.1
MQLEIVWHQLCFAQHVCDGSGRCFRLRTDVTAKQIVWHRLCCAQHVWDVSGRCFLVTVSLRPFTVKRIGQTHVLSTLYTCRILPVLVS